MKTEIEKQAYAMQESYKRFGGLGSAIQRVKSRHPDADNNILEAMRPETPTETSSSNAFAAIAGSAPLPFNFRLNIK